MNEQNANKRKEKLTSPDRDVFALSFHHDGRHRHGDGNGVEIWRVWGEGEDGSLCWQSLSAFNADPVKSTRKPHDPHDGPQHQVHYPAEEGWVRDQLMKYVGCRFWIQNGLIVILGLFV